MRYAERCVYCYLSIKDSASFDRVGETAEHEARRHFAVVNAFDLDLDILPAGDGCDLNVIRPDLLHFDLRLAMVDIRDTHDRDPYPYLVGHH